MKLCALLLAALIPCLGQPLPANKDKAFGNPSAAVRLDMPADYNAFVVVLEGEGAIGEERRRIVAGDVARLPPNRHRSSWRRLRSVFGWCGLKNR